MATAAASLDAARERLEDEVRGHGVEAVGEAVGALGRGEWERAERLAWAELHERGRAFGDGAEWRTVFAAAKLGVAADAVRGERWADALRSADEALILSGDVEVPTEGGDVTSLSSLAAAWHALLPPQQEPLAGETWPPLIASNQAKRARRQDEEETAPPSIPAIANPPLHVSLSLTRESRPVVLTKSFSWPAHEKWTPAYLVHVAGARTVPVERGPRGTGYTDPRWRIDLQPLASFLRDFVLSPEASDKDEYGYLAQHALLSQIPELGADVLTPDMVVGVPRVSVWIGPAGTVTPFHTDEHANINVQVVGRKRWVVRVSDSDRPPLELQADVGPGDGIFLPKGMSHHVTSLDASVSVSFWFDP